MLYKTHQLAKENNVEVSYDGIDSLEVEIPRGAPSIPLTSYTDFCGLVLTIGCNYDNYIMFEMTQDVSEIPINKVSVDKGSYKDYPELTKGLYLLQLTDENLWVKQRVGFDYGHQRMDVVLVKNATIFNEDKKSERLERIDELLKFVELERVRKSFVRELSGGMKRRLLIVRALIHKPQILFLDEPTVALDPQVRRKIWELVQQLKSRGITIVLTTHYIEEAEFLCDRVAILSAGKLVALDSTKNLCAGKSLEEVFIALTK